ncbi:hypothetical protein N7509_010522 [Penicillium cosmopolitanum]|uniref:PHD-type domain-containing protein n=1 Tax=Penicillium cosmopolitanum TaxID=1131564 RepID=A0A9X0B4Q2_9EURO|nr:uncharacterized protein N7509_010522 [Penicillium cosmopolitanum]KAJ5387981.1 hypothetical protein N7509_010522 [Penicillium cosmopolitanum]
MVTRKRSRSEAVATTEKQPAEELGLLQRIRNSWEFASLMQYIAIFGGIMKIDNEFEIEDLEDECLKPEPSYKLLEIGLCLLKWISSHRGLTFDNFDEYTRRQYNAKALDIPNPFGQDEVPLRFLDFDVFLKLRVLHQLSVWTFWNQDRIRDKMPEKKESEQLQWRIEEFGWDRDGRSYYVLDDNRLYRRTEPAIPAPQRPKKKPKSRSSRKSRTSKRTSTAAVEEGSDEEGQAQDTDGSTSEYKWECVAVTLPEYQEFIDTIRKSKDADERQLRERLEEHVLPILEKAEEAQQRKRQKREKELHNMQLLAGAKRSSRLAAKEEKERSDRDAVETARKHENALAEARREQSRKQQLEVERQSRMMTREQRTKDREQKRILHQEEMDKLKIEEERLERGEGRISARNLKAERDKMQKNLADLVQEDEWVFDCSGCGVYGENLDDGSHSVACEKCNVWQHSSCLGISKEDAEKEDFHFVCRDCKRKEEEAKKPKIAPLKFRLSTSASPSSAPPREQSAHLQNGPSAAQASTQPHLPPVPARAQYYVPPSPERRQYPANQSSFPSSSPSRPSFSPSKGMDAPAYPSMKPLPGITHNGVSLPPMQPGPHLPSFGSFQSARPSSSHSGHGAIQNRPSMSPTQGNHEVGPLAGFPPSQQPANGPGSWSPFQNQNQSYTTPRPQSGHGGTFAMSSNYPSFSAAATPNGNHNHSSPPSKLTRHRNVWYQPHQAVSSSSYLRRYGSSPDAPIPPPVKCMTPEQEERRQRENAIRHHYPSNGQAHPMSSPSINRIPSLGPAATSQLPDPVPSPQHGDQDHRQ